MSRLSLFRVLVRTTGDLKDMDKELLQEIEEAQMVLVGLGCALDASEAKSGDDIAVALLKEQDMGYLLPLFYERRQSESVRKDIQNGLVKLAGLLENKNCFVITEAKNSAVFQAKWREGRLVAPYGSSRMVQCLEACEGSAPKELDEESCQALVKAMDAFLSKHDAAEESYSRTDTRYQLLSEEVKDAMLAIEKRETIGDYMDILRQEVEGILGRCECCGAANILNVSPAEKYDQRGYKQDWERYTKWLSGSVNRNLLLLEIGVDESRPGLIHGPFSKISELNLKAKRRTYANVIDWLRNL